MRSSICMRHREAELLRPFRTIEWNRHSKLNARRRGFLGSAPRLRAPGPDYGRRAAHLVRIVHCKRALKKIKASATKLSGHCTASNWECLLLFTDDICAIGLSDRGALGLRHDVKWLIYLAHLLKGIKRRGSLNVPAIPITGQFTMVNLR